MKKLNQAGQTAGLLIPLILVTILFIGAMAFAVWAFIGRQDYKNNSDQKAAAAVSLAEQATSTKKDNEFVQKEKLPLKTYVGPSAFGSLTLQYPKTWSAYISESASGSAPVDATLHPNFVPGSGDVSYALRFQVVNTAYAAVVRTFEANIKSGKIIASAYIPAKVTSVTGVRLDGEIAPKKQGSMVILPLRDKTIKIWTESSDFVSDFNTSILPNISFSQ